MNKELFYYLFAVLCTVTLFTSCSDDDGDDLVLLCGRHHYDLAVEVLLISFLVIKDDGSFSRRL